MQERFKPVDDPDFWKKRIEESVQDIRHSVYRAPRNVWDQVCRDHYRILHQEIGATDKVLDAGCGYGRACKMMPTELYTGVDMSPDFIKIARERYPDKDFRCANLASLPFPDNHFDISVCISIMIMITQNLGWFKWEEIQNELLRVSRKGILCIEYGGGDTNTSSDTYFRIEKYS